MGSPASRQLTIEVSGLSSETMTTSAVKDALRAHLGSTEFVPLLSLQRGYEYVTCFEAVWRAFAGDQTRALMPVMRAARYVAAMLRSHRADGTLFSPPPEQGLPPKKKAKVKLAQPQIGRQPPAPVAMSPPPAAFPPPPTLPPQGSPQASPWPPAKERRPRRPGCRAAERGGY